MTPMIRKAKIKDIPRICDLVSLMTPGESDYTNAQLKFETHIQNNPDYFLWVVEIGNKIVGTGMMHLQHKLSYSCGTAGHLEDVVVDTNYRKIGVGTLIVETAEAVAREHNCYKLFLTCRPKTIPFYENLGFENHDIGMRKSL